MGIIVRVILVTMMMTGTMTDSRFDNAGVGYNNSYNDQNSADDDDDKDNYDERDNAVY